ATTLRSLRCPPRSNAAIQISSHPRPICEDRHRIRPRLSFSEKTFSHHAFDRHRTEASFGRTEFCRDHESIGRWSLEIGAIRTSYRKNKSRQCACLRPARIESHPPASYHAQSDRGCRCRRRPNKTRDKVFRPTAPE